VGWLLLVALGIIWAAFLLPTRERSLNLTIEDFERNMDLLADTEGNGRGRWIVTPRKGMAFVGTRERARERARERRRRIFVVMLESTGIAFMIGLVPPLRAMWFVAGTLMILLGLYVWLLVTLKHRAPSVSRAATLASDPVRANGHARVANGARPASNGHARPSSNGHGLIGDDDLLNIVVRPASERKRESIRAARV
jgi:hypothetical protein